MWIAMFKHGTDSTALGVGTDFDYAVAALLRAYPAAAGHAIDVGEIRAGQGFVTAEEIVSLRIATTENQGKQGLATQPKAQEMSSNGHETNGEMATRNLSISVDKLREMRWMIEKAGGDLDAFDAGVIQLERVCHGITGTD